MSTRLLCHFTPEPIVFHLVSLSLFFAFCFSCLSSFFFSSFFLFFSHSFTTFFGILLYFTFNWLFLFPPYNYIFSMVFFSFYRRFALIHILTSASRENKRRTGWLFITRNRQTGKRAFTNSMVRRGHIYYSRMWQLDRHFFAKLTIFISFL